MYTIYYIFGNRLETMKARDKRALKYLYKSLTELDAKIVAIIDIYGEVVNENLT